MNRLFIIGNGFDLAHGLPTSYKHFIDDYWKTICEAKGSKKIRYSDNLVFLNCVFGYIFTEEEILAIENINSYKDLNQVIIRNSQNRRDGVFEINFANKFFKIICEKSTENWVDIENLYYNILKSIADGSYIKYDYPYGIQQLNNEFEQVKVLLETYLQEKVEDTNIIPDVFNLFKIESTFNKYSLEFSSEDYNELEEFYTKYNPDLEEGKNVLNYCLNFNYTRTIDSYIKKTKDYKEYRDFGVFTNLQIHGRLSDKNNLVNFGFGDEMDDDYKRIENLNDNEYLKNFKSFQYLQNSNYKKLLDFIDGNKFQVVILGHSCGLSDRTLLNTIFEHTNCRSIKVYYHQKDDGSDNYTEIIQNISRHFNKKKLMREKIVNKTLCKPLPQIQLPLKK